LSASNASLSNVFALLGCERECSGLIGVDGVGEVVDAEESLMGFGDDGDLVER